MTSCRQTVPLAIAAVLGTSAIAPAQTRPAADDLTLPPLDSEPAPSGSGGGTVEWSLSGGAEYQFGTDEFDAWRAGATLGARTRMGNVDVSLGFQYAYDSYDFDSNTSFGPDPWENVHTFGLALTLSTAIADDWDIFGGPIFQISMEEGADTGDSWVGGGTIGVTHQVHEDLMFGLGFGIVDQLQDPVRFFPIIILDWQITNDMRLTTRGQGGGASRTGVELVFDIEQDVEFAIGTAFQFRRFRLDDDPGLRFQGVGEETGLQVKARMTFETSATTRLTAYAGLIVGGEIELETSDGGKIDDNYDPSGIIGVTASIRF